MTMLEDLEAARAKVAQGWCQGVHARDKNGIKVLSVSDLATRWCAAGALLAVGATSEASELLLKTIGDPPHGSIPIWNDVPERSQADVLAAFDQAIASLS
jgi:hypothetical protein